MALTNKQKADIIERWVNNPNIPFQTLSLAYKVSVYTISGIITKCWFGPTGETETITIKSNEELWQE